MLTARYSKGRDLYCLDTVRAMLRGYFESTGDSSAGLLECHERRRSIALGLLPGRRHALCRRAGTAIARRARKGWQDTRGQGDLAPSRRFRRYRASDPRHHILRRDRIDIAPRRHRFPRLWCAMPVGPHHRPGRRRRRFVQDARLQGFGGIGRRPDRHPRKLYRHGLARSQAVPLAAASCVICSGVAMPFMPAMPP